MFYDLTILYYLLHISCGIFLTIELVVKVTGTAHDNDNDKNDLHLF